MYSVEPESSRVKEALNPHFSSSKSNVKEVVSMPSLHHAQLKYQG